MVAIAIMIGTNGEGSCVMYKGMKREKVQVERSVTYIDRSTPGL